MIIPEQGVSAIDAQDQPFDSPEARAAWTRNLKENVADNVGVIEMDNNINDDAFAARLAETLLQNLKHQA